MPDLIIVLAIVLILVLIWRGPKTLPDLGKALGRGVREARSEAREIRADIDGRDATPGDSGADDPATRT